MQYCAIQRRRPSAASPKGGGIGPPPFVVFALALNKAHVLALNTAHVLRLNKADVLALKEAHVLALNTAHVLPLNRADVLVLNKARVLRLNYKIRPVFRAGTKEAAYQVMIFDFSRDV